MSGDEKRLANGVYRPRRHARRVKGFDPVRSIVLLQDGVHQGHQCVQIGHPITIGGKTGIITPLGMAHNLGDTLPVCLVRRSEEHTSELQSLMRISYAVFCLKKKKYNHEYKVLNIH